MTINVTSNDRDVDAGTLALFSAAANGSVTLSGSEFVYTPNADFAGSDSFRYSVTGNDGTQLNATVSITVNDINDPPVAQDDAFTLVEDNTLALTLAANDTDIDDAIASFEIIGSVNGSIAGTGTSLTFTPPADFTGEVSFSYQAVDSRGGTSNKAAVTITVNPVTVTAMQVETLPLPQSGYAAANDAELGQTVLMSPPQELIVPPNAVSVLLSLSGQDANIDANGLFIASVTPPSGVFPVYQRFVHFCFGGACTSLVPRTPDYQAESGVWTYTLGTLAGNLDNIDFSGLEFTATVRTGPTPDTTAAVPAALQVNAFVTTDAISITTFEAVLQTMQGLAAANDIELTIGAVTRVTDAAYTRVSSSFLDETTNALVNLGNPDTVNLFFVDGFTNTETVGGISGGIPGTLGAQDGHNGVLVNASTQLGGSEAFYIQQTAEIAFHEMGHLLGLYHTTEAQFSANDVLDDTAACQRSVHDANGDGVAGSNECPDAANPMFWQNSILTEWEPLSEGQKHVIFYSPLAVPGS